MCINLKGIVFLLHFKLLNIQREGWTTIGSCKKMNVGHQVPNSIPGLRFGVPIIFKKLVSCRVSLNLLETDEFELSHAVLLLVTAKVN